MKRNRFFFMLMSLLVVLEASDLFLVTKPVGAQEAEPDNTLNQMVQVALTNHHNSRFDLAIDQAITICRAYPDNVEGPFCLLTTYQTIMRNYRVRNYEAQYDSLLDRAIELAKQAIKKNKKDGISYFYLGCLYGSRSIFHAQRRKWLPALRDGSKVLNNFNRALLYNPDFYDSYYGIGLYKYWFSAKMKKLRFLPFGKDERFEGLAKIKIAMAKGHLLNVNARHALSTAYFNEGNFEQSKVYNDQLYLTYPTNPTVLYRRGKIYQEMEDWGKAVFAFQKLMHLLKGTEYKSVSYQVECLFRQAESHYELGNYFETQRLCREATTLEKQCNFSNEIDGPLSKFSDIKKKLHKLDDKVQSILVAQARSSGGQ